jgi:two-component system phosphate regulon sensor histidine kinase PhoR
MLGVGLLTALVVTLLDDRSLTHGARAILEHELREHGVLLEAVAGDVLRGAGAPELLQTRLRELGKRNATRYTVLDAQGRVLADTGAEPNEMENHRQRPEVAQAARAEDGIGTARRYSTSVDEELIYQAHAVRDGKGHLLGFVRVARPPQTFHSVIAANRKQLLFAAAVAVALAAVVAWLLARGIVKPVAHLQHVAQAMAQGEDRARAAVWTDDEFAELGRALNTMADRLQERVEDMRRERAKLSAILGSMVEGVAGVDAEERVLHLNAAAADMLGVEAAQAVGRPLLEVTRIPEIYELVTAILRAGAKATREATIHKGGDARVVQFEAAPLRDRAGAVLGAVLVLHDVTELRRLEGMRRDFVANVSHELKTPLTAIKGMIDTMVDDAHMPDDVRARFLDKIKRQADRLASLVSDLLVLARIEAAKGSEEHQRLDLRQPVRESCQQLAAAAQDKRLRVLVELPEEQIIVQGEAESLRQVVDNLLGNAIRYTPPGGEIAVSVTARAGEAVITVRDSGIGIEAQHLDRIFERFYRVDKARSRELGGTGLGLAIVKHVALAHGGTVSVHSRPGRGSSFHVNIPLAPALGEHRKVS